VSLADGRDGLGGTGFSAEWAGHVGRGFGDQVTLSKGPLQLLRWFRFTVWPVESALGLAFFLHPWSYCQPLTGSRGQVDGQLQIANWRRVFLVGAGCSLAVHNGSQSSVATINQSMGQTRVVPGSRNSSRL